MLEFLDNLDRALFMFLNVTLSNPITDLIMPVITSDYLLRALYGLAIILFIWKGDRKLRWLIVASALTLLFTDQLSAGFLKPLIGRMRPCHTLGEINLLVGCGGGKAMPSSHAANAFGQALLFSFHYRVVRWYLIGFAALVAVSRVFVGVHYPGDVLAGAMIGALIGLILAVVFRHVFGRTKRNAVEAGSS